MTASKVRANAFNKPLAWDTSSVCETTLLLRPLGTSSGPRGDLRLGRMLDASGARARLGYEANMAGTFHNAAGSTTR